MDKLDMQTPDITNENIEKLARIFPDVITETKDENGNITKGIDFDLLKQILSKDVVEGAKERYRLDWPGKKASLLKANTPITKTLRPVKEESVNFDTTENLYIEGDNFEVLKILQESYLNKVKMIYIDPPYNTGKDFIYRDNFKQSKEEYNDEIGTENEDGEKLFKNTDTNGRFHSDWLSMMYERLIVARDLLRDDGVIFISIDDNEVHNLRKICDEIFGEENFLSEMIWHSKGGSGTDAKTISNEIEYILVYSKNINNIFLNKFSYSTADYNLKDEYFKTRGHFKLNKLDRKSLGYIKSLDFPIKYLNLIAIPGGSTEENKKKIWRWRWSKEKVEWGLKNGFVILKEGKNKIVSAYYKIYENVDNEGNIIERKRPFVNIIPEGITTSNGTHEIEKFFKSRLFEYPKPSIFINHLLKIATSPSDIVLDFFAGSSTTAHSVMQLNAEDGGNRKFIMVQLPEKTDEDSEAYKHGYKTISDIGKERIRRAGKKIKKELSEKSQQAELGDKGIGDAEKLDIGFRVYKTDTSNMRDVYYHPNELSQRELDGVISNIKSDRNGEDLLTQVILDLGLELSLPIEEKEIHGHKVYIVQTNALVACFDDNIDFKIVDETAKLKPLKVVFKDGSFKDDKDKINLRERFKNLSPETIVTVI